MTASRAHRRGPSPSLADDVHARLPDGRASACDDHGADDRTPEARPRPAEAAADIPFTAVPAVPLLASASGATPAAPVDQAHLLRTTVPAHPSRSPRLRAMVTEHLRHLRLAPEHLDNAVLATDELFGNALKHGSPDRGDTVTVTVEYTRCELRVTVADRSPALPRPRTADGAEESGRGLAIVAALTDDWGVAPPDPGLTGKKVWFTLVLQGLP
ncbi:ATP-binding protein [Streptomyces sp. Tue6028]|uniref:ATP-binding protein n=1 Tax=Streptomyces sp. Tue6028 TaxID=2036037 RepID=UPI003EB96128